MPHMDVRRLLCGIAIFLLSFQAFARSSFTTQDLLKEGRSSIYSGDYYKAFRMYSSLAQTSPGGFIKDGLPGFFESLFIVGSWQNSEHECDQFINSKLKRRFQVAFLCGQEFLERKLFKKAVEALEHVPKDDPLRFPASILMSTAELAQGNGQRALDRLAYSKKEYEAAGFGDLANLARARCLIQLDKGEEAIRYYQLITEDSPHYAEAVEETAWVFFKARKLESAQVLADVLINNYESIDRRVKNLRVSANLYFKMRYLRAYIALLQKRLPESESFFSSLKTDYEKYQKSLSPPLEQSRVVQELKTSLEKWGDPRSYSSSAAKTLDVVEQWRGADARRGLERLFKFQMALARESSRLQDIGATSPEIMAYKRKIESLKQAHWKNIERAYQPLLSSTQRILDAFALKADLGRLEIVWLNRADGIRNLDQAVENYREQVGAVDDFLEL